MLAEFVRNTSIRISTSAPQWVHKSWVPVKFQGSSFNILNFLSLLILSSNNSCLEELLVWYIGSWTTEDFKWPNIPQQRDANCINFTCLTKGPHSAILFCLAGQVSLPVAGKANLTFGGRCPESNSGPTSVCTVQCMWRGVLHWIVRWWSWTYGQTPSKLFLCWTLYKHERRGRKQQHDFKLKYRSYQTLMRYQKLGRAR